MKPIQHLYLIKNWMGDGAAFGSVITSYSKWNPYDKSGNVLLTNNYLTTNRNGGQGVVRGTIGKSTGKWYWEIQVLSTSSTYDVWTGIANSTASLANAPGQSDVNAWAIALDGGDYYHNGFIGVASGSWPAVTNDVFGFALDMDNGTLKVYRNNTVLTPDPLFTGIAGTIYPCFFLQNDATVTTANFGASTLTYTPPSGYNAGLYT